MDHPEGAGSDRVDFDCAITFQLAEVAVTGAMVRVILEPPRVYRRAKLSENCPLWNMHKRRRR